MILFIIARGGLSLAVVAWSISQWVGIITSVTVENCSAQVVVCSKGVATAAGTAFSELRVHQVLPLVDVAEASWVFEPRNQDIEPFACTHPIPGVNYLTHGSVVLISIRHWFIIAAFALLRGGQVYLPPVFADAALLQRFTLTCGRKERFSAAVSLLPRASIVDGKK